MTDEKPRVIIIPPKPEFQQTATVTKQLRVAAYCRVSTKEEEQASSYEAQCEYYTDKIMSNKEWTMAGIFADEGITGTSTKKRTEFLRMIRQCKQKKIDLILTKSIQRFARNTLDCINYTRILRQFGIGVLFEKENINSLPPDSEFMITMYGAMAQSESESISGNIRRGRQMHAKVGTLKVPCYRLYGYEKNTEGKFRVIPEQAEIVRELYKRYESGASLRNLQDWLEENQIKTVLGESKWTATSIKSILTNEKYCGDVLLQKTFRTDVISKKVIKNVGQMAQYYMPDHHEAIVSREQYNAVKAEMARRSALRSPSKSAVTGRSCYTSKYALSDRLVCGECGTLYRRCTWTSLGRKYPVWRCTSRLNYGTKYCHDSPTIKEEPLQNAILAAVNETMSEKPVLLDHIKSAMSLELLPVQGQTMSLADIDRRLAQLDAQFQSLLAEAIDVEDRERCNAKFAEILAEQTELKKQKEHILQSSTDAERTCARLVQAEQALEQAAPTITEWSESTVRQLVERVTVLSADEVLVQLKGGKEIHERLE
jgi:site-specific DNA recombinase